MDRQTDKVNPIYPPPTSLGEGIVSIQYKLIFLQPELHKILLFTEQMREITWQVQEMIEYVNMFS